MQDQNDIRHHLVREIRYRFSPPLTQKELGVILSLRSDYISKIENGKAELSDNFCRRFSVNLGINYEFLQTGLGEAFPLGLPRVIRSTEGIKIILPRRAWKRTIASSLREEILDLFSKRFGIDLEELEIDHLPREERLELHRLCNKLRILFSEAENVLDTNLSSTEYEDQMPLPSALLRKQKSLTRKRKVRQPLVDPKNPHLFTEFESGGNFNKDRQDE